MPDTESLKRQQQRQQAPPPPPPPFSVPHFAADVSQRRDGGVMKIVRRVATGDPNDVPGHEDLVTVHLLAVCHGGDRDGQKVESTRDRNCRPIEFVISKSKTIVPGVHQAVKTMRIGEMAVAFVRSDYAFGRKGCQSLDIPPNQHMMYELELLDYRGEDISPQQDGSVLKSIVKKGTGFLYLPIGSQLTVSVKGRHKGELFDSQIVEFELGVGDEKGIPEGVEQACQRMIPGEVARVIIQPSYSFGVDLTRFQLPQSAILHYEIELLRYQKPPEHFEVNPAEKLKQAKLAKDKGGVYFAKGRIKQALNHYENVLNYIEHDPDFASVAGKEFEEFREERRQVLLAGRLNCSICYLKLNNFKEALQQCDLVLSKLDKNNVKALYRRGMANIGVQELEKAMKDFESVLRQESGNSSAKRQIEICRNLMHENAKMQQQMCKNIFR